MNKYTINDITRASGGFAMLAVDQREAMRRLCHLPVLFRISQPDYMYQRL